MEEISFESEPLNIKRGVRIPERWTGVISLDDDNLKRINLREIATDLMLAPNLPGLSTKRRERNWALVFFAKDFVKEHTNITLENYELPQKKLKELGIEVSKAREKFKEASSFASKETDQDKATNSTQG